MNIKEIITKYLQNGCYDGLAYDGNNDDCECTIECIMPCNGTGDAVILFCEPFRVKEDQNN